MYLAENQWVENELVVGALVASISALLAALAAWIKSRAMDEVKAQTQDIHHQVKNDHNTNLREDIDHILALARKAVEVGERNSTEIGHLRQEIHMERRERQSLSDRLDSHVDAARSGS